jgi:hypothetical protein
MAFPYPSKGFLTLSFKGRKSAILTLLVKNYNFERCGQNSTILKYLAILGELRSTSQRFINCCNCQ